MNKEDYFKYYIQGSDHYLIPKDVFIELFEEMENWREEAKELKEKYLNAVADYETTMFEKEQLNSLVNSCQEEIRQLKKQLEERPKEYVFIGNAQNKTRDFINQITKDNKEFKNQQKEFMNFLTEAINKLKLKQKTSNSAILKANIDLQVEVYSIVLSKYKEIIGDDK